METVIGGLVLAAVSGLAWFAYNHPDRFVPFSVGLMFIWAAACILAVTWSMGVMWTKVEAVPFIDGAKWKAFEAAADRLKFDLMPLCAVMFAVHGYLWFLHSVVATLKNDRK